MMLQDLLERLDGVRPTGDGYMAKCPAHDDRKASLSVTERGGRILLHCHAGCSFEAVRDALSLRNSDLRTDTPELLPGRRRIVASYDYRDESGTLLYQVVRYQPKEFRQRRPDGHGGWSWKLNRVRRVLYRLPELMAANPERTIYIAEGEKAADRLAREGLTATCSPGGAGKWRDEYAEVLRGRRVVVLPDNDAPGRSHAEAVARSLHGIAASVKAVELPGLASKADVYDWLEASHTADELERLAARAPEWEATTTEPNDPTLLPAVRDLAHAEALADLWRDHYRWAGHRGTWMAWTGQRWEPVTEQQAATGATTALRKHYARQLGEARDREEIGRLTGLVTDACTYSRIVGALSFLKGFAGFHTDAEAWDADPWLLNVANGTIDLRTGTLKPHDPADLCTKLAPVTFDPEAKGPTWEAHLSYFLPDGNVRRQVQRDLGMALVGADLEEMLPIWYGVGANGKSTTARTIQAVLGDYASRAAPNLLIQRRHEQHPTEVADLAGRRVVFSVEVGSGAQLDEAKAKDLSGGDRIKARYMRQDFFEFDSTWTIFLLCNHKPVIGGTDVGIWRRVRLIPWTVSMPRQEQQPQEEVVVRLVAEGSAVLRWLLDGLADWRRDPHWLADEVRAATKDYRAEQDRLAGFLAECCEERLRVSVGVGELYDAYAAWCEEAGEEPLGKRAFGERLRDRGITQKRPPGGRTRRWVGIRLVTSCDNTSGSSPMRDDLLANTESLSHSVTERLEHDGHDGGMRTDRDNTYGSSLMRDNLPGDTESLSLSAPPCSVSGSVEPELGPGPSGDNGHGQPVVTVLPLTDGPKWVSVSKARLQELIDQGLSPGEAELVAEYEAGAPC